MQLNALMQWIAAVAGFARSRFWSCVCRATACPDSMTLTTSLVTPFVGEREAPSRRFAPDVCRMPRVLLLDPDKSVVFDVRAVECRRSLPSSSQPGVETQPWTRKFGR